MILLLLFPGKISAMVNGEAWSSQDNSIMSRSLVMQSTYDADSSVGRKAINRQWKPLTSRPRR